MDWLQTKRRPQLPVECPDNCRGDRRYVERATRNQPDPPVLAGLMPIGRHWRGKPISAVPTSYLEWVLRDVRGRGKLKDAIRVELAAREEAGKLIHPTEPASDDANLDSTQPQSR